MEERLPRHIASRRQHRRVEQRAAPREECRVRPLRRAHRRNLVPGAAVLLGIFADVRHDTPPSLSRTSSGSTSHPSS